MKERPIIFSTEMVKAILESRKTMTRRVIKPQPLAFHPENHPHLEWLDWGDKGCYTREEVIKKCPYGQVGDRLWVKETWYDDKGELYYKADWAEDQVDYVVPKWRSSLFMPRWASRILLEITEIRVERLQEITEEDVIAEGIARYTFARGCASPNPPDPRWKFIELWDSLNAKRGYRWEKNPWVWVISFRRLTDDYLRF